MAAAAYWDMVTGASGTTAFTCWDSEQPLGLAFADGVLVDLLAGMSPFEALFALKLFMS